jgi:hypothetical protein
MLFFKRGAAFQQSGFLRAAMLCFMGRSREEEWMRCK